MVPHDDGWAVTSEGSQRADRVSDTKAKAERIGRTVAKNQQVEIVVHDRAGKLQNPAALGTPPRDRKR